MVWSGDAQPYEALDLAVTSTIHENGEHRMNEQQGKPAETASDHEPSMEDILASIRRAIAEDGEDSDRNVTGEDGAGDEPDFEPVPPSMVSTPSSPPPASPQSFPPPPQEADEGIFDLTRDMAVPDQLVSSRTMAQSADVLNELARTLVEHHDVPVNNPGSAGGPTLEMMVREVLKPLLSDWLERNLPHLVERLVKQEIDRIINKAQHLKR